MSTPFDSEARVTINDRELTSAETLSLRVAVSSFRTELRDPTHREALGEKLASAYDRNLQRVEYLLCREP